MCENGLPVHNGAFICALERQLGEMNVHREAYYGGTFKGNNAHKCLKVLGFTYTIHHMYNEQNKGCKMWTRYVLSYPK